MAKLFTSAEICDHALRQIGSFSVYDTGSDPQSFAVTLERLDMLIAEMTGTTKLWFFTPQTQRIALEEGESEYELSNLLDDPLEFIQHVFLVRGEDQTPLVQVRRDEYDGWIDDPLTGGEPEVVYIERKDNPSLFVLPVPQDGDELLIMGQKYSDDVTTDHGNVPHGFPTAWQRALIMQLAADIGAGPVTRIPDNELDRLEKGAARSFRRLDAYNNRENVRRPRYTKPREF